MLKFNFFLLFLVLSLLIATQGQPIYLTISPDVEISFNYFMIKADATWSKSEEFCKKYDMTIAKYDASKKQEFIESCYGLAKYDYSYCWIGYEEYGKLKCYYARIHNKIFLKERCYSWSSSKNIACMRNRNIKQVDLAKKIEKYTGIKFSTDNFKKFYHADGLELPPSLRPTTRPTIKLIHESYEEYMSRIEYHSQQTWDGAKKDCESYGTEMVTPYSESEDKYLVAKTPNENIWLGLKKSSNYFRYFNNKMVKSGYTGWNPGEPDGYYNYCVERYKNGKWNDRHCYDDRNFFCYRKPNIYLSSKAASYDKAVKLCKKVFTAKSWFDLKYTHSLANGKHYWTGSQRKDSNSESVTPEGKINSFTNQIKSETGCSWSHMLYTYQATSCNLQKHIFCIDENKPYLSNERKTTPTKFQTNKPTYYRYTRKPTWTMTMPIHRPWSRYPTYYSYHSTWYPTHSYNYYSNYNSKSASLVWLWVLIPIISLTSCITFWVCWSIERKKRNDRNAYSVAIANNFSPINQPNNLANEQQKDKPSVASAIVNAGVTGIEGQDDTGNDIPLQVKENLLNDPNKPVILK